MERIRTLWAHCRGKGGADYQKLVTALEGFLRESDNKKRIIKLEEILKNFPLNIEGRKAAIQDLENFLDDLKKGRVGGEAGRISVGVL